MSATKTLAVAIAVAALAVAAYMRGAEKEREAMARKAPAEVQPAKASDRGTLSPTVPIAPATPAALKAPTPVGASKVSALMADVNRGRNYKAIYERLSTSPQRTAEETYALAEILGRCAKGGEMAPGFAYRPRLGGEDRRQQFVGAISDKDPNRDKRIASFDEINHDPCTGLTLQTTAKDVRELIAVAAAAGDPKARAHQVQLELLQQKPERRADGTFTRSISDAQLDTLRDVLASSDPNAVLQAARVLLTPVDNLAIRVGPGEATLDQGAFNNAAQLIACDLGEACGADAQRLLEACALYGNCGARDLREHILYYGLSAASAQNLQTYYDELHRARGGDWSYFNFHRGPAPRAATQQRPR